MQALGGQVVLIVEDEPLFGRALQQGLEEAGAQLARAGLREAPACVQLIRPSTAVLDCQPPSRERRALIRELRKQRVPFIFYSAEPPAHSTTERGVPFVPRPCVPEMMVAALRYVLGDRERPQTKPARPV